MISPTQVKLSTWSPTRDATSAGAIGHPTSRIGGNKVATAAPQMPAVRQATRRQLAVTGASTASAEDMAFLVDTRSGRRGAVRRLRGSRDMVVDRRVSGQRQSDRDA